MDVRQPQCLVEFSRMRHRGQSLLSTIDLLYTYGVVTSADTLGGTEKAREVLFFCKLVKHLYTSLLTIVLNLQFPSLCSPPFPSLLLSRPHNFLAFPFFLPPCPILSLQNRRIEIITFNDDDDDDDDYYRKVNYY